MPIYAPLPSHTPSIRLCTSIRYASLSVHAPLPPMQRLRLRSRPSVQPPALTTCTSLSVPQKRRPQNPLASRRNATEVVGDGSRPSLGHLTRPSAPQPRFAFVASSAYRAPDLSLSPAQVAAVVQDGFEHAHGVAGSDRTEVRDI
ncbi:hypothetical protein BKA56DRAFT_621328 [Ilyonectria sp. MPI-CAGE-AT-0026]|nr:hypothetical protein BKA56DRAFT_621328 [Ilyonectria sp. MPI-CAGE-AT-0026]